jgi:hypothetical protein
LAAPAEPVIENDLPLDLSCNSRRRSEDEEDDGEFRHETDRRPSANGRMMDAKETDMRSSGLSIGGPPSPPRSPTSDFRALSDLGYVAYHRQLMAMERQRQWLLEHQQHAADGLAAQQDGEEENAKDRDRSRRHYRIHRYQRHQRRNKTRNNEGGEDGDHNEVDEHQQLDGDDDLLIMRRQRRRRSPLGYDDEEDDEEDEEECLGSDAEGDSDDSHQNPMDLGLANPKAYKKSLMKRYRKFTKRTEIFGSHLLHISFIGSPFLFFRRKPFFRESLYFYFGLLFMALVSVSCRTHFAIVWS